MLANVGDSLVNDEILDDERERSDIRSLGTIMMELTEPEKYLLDPKSIDLKNAGKWKNGLGILDFLASTRDQSLRVLEKVSYLLNEIRPLH